MLRRYKEIIFGCALGFAMWVVDAAMHAQLEGGEHATNFMGELLHPGATQLLFRLFFVLIAAAFGWALWRANWRERELQAMERAVVAFHRQLDSRALRIINHTRMLQGRGAVVRDDVARELAAAISDDAQIVDVLARQYMRFSEQVLAGRNLEAVETLRAIEELTSAKATARTQTILS